jgi:glycosyltransferase involved in cell wall biosynthesis
VRQQDDPARFDIRKITLDAPFKKYGLFKRWSQERKIGQAVIDIARDFKPDRIISANTPLGAQGLILRFARSRRIPFTFWLQDMLSIGIARQLAKRLRLLGAAIGLGFRIYEEMQLILSSSIVSITPDFVDQFPKWLMKRGSVNVIENWAPLEELPLRPRSNAFSRQHGLENKTCLLYAGTLGLKHNPELLADLAVQFRGREDVRIVVISEGIGADYLNKRKRESGLINLILLPFQDFHDMPDVLASADILIAILEREAGEFAVPSKVLTYLCAERPLLTVIPRRNLAARIILKTGAGLSFDPEDHELFVCAAKHLVDYPSVRASMSRRAREYAERTFDIQLITSKFEAILETQGKRLRRANPHQRELETSHSL